MYDLLLIFDLGSWPVLWDLGTYLTQESCMENLIDISTQWSWIQDNFWCIKVENI